MPRSASNQSRRADRAGPSTTAQGGHGLGEGRLHLLAVGADARLRTYDLPSEGSVSIGRGPDIDVGSSMALIEARFWERLDEVFDDEPQGAPRLHRSLLRALDHRRRLRSNRRTLRRRPRKPDLVARPGHSAEGERRVVAAAAAGGSNKEIAFDLGISPATTRVLIARACARLGVESRAQLLELPSVKALGGEPPGA